MAYVKLFHYRLKETQGSAGKGKTKICIIIYEINSHLMRKFQSQNVLQGCIHSKKGGGVDRVSIVRRCQCFLYA